MRMGGTDATALLACVFCVAVGSESTGLVLVLSESLGRRSDEAAELSFRFGGGSEDVMSASISLNVEWAPTESAGALGRRDGNLGRVKPVTPALACGLEGPEASAVGGRKWLKLSSIPSDSGGGLPLRALDRMDDGSPECMRDECAPDSAGKDEPAVDADCVTRKGCFGL